MGSPVLTDVTHALSRPTYTARCSEVRNVFTRLSVKDLHQVFPQLLANVFGFHGSMDWGLKSLTRAQYQLDFDAVLAFLSPNGTAFQLIETLQRDPDVLFEFPVSCLPAATKQQLMFGTVPLLYQKKLQRPHNNFGRVVESNQPVIWLNAFEYYMFHFAYWLVVWASSKSEPPWTDLGNSLYLAILDSYCRAFLPTEGNVNVRLTSTMSSQLSSFPVRSTQSPLPSSTRHHWSPETALLSWNGLSSPCDYKPVPGLLKASSLTLSTSGLISCQENYANETWCSETFAQILVEFWLNQVLPEQSVGISFVNVGQTLMPPQEHVRLVRGLIKRVHGFATGASRNQDQSLVTLQLRRTIIPNVFQKKTLTFLHHLFIHWPLDSTFRVVLETWLTYIQPWRYVTNNGQQSPNMRQPDWNHWKPFIQDNIQFYTMLMTEFLQRALKLNLMDLRDTVLIQRVAKVFSVRDLVAIIEDCDTDAVVESSISAVTVSGFLPAINSATQSQYNHQLVIRGIRKCNPSTVKPRIDPLLMPICSHENAILVRLLHHVSQKLYDKIGPTLLQWRGNGGPLSWLATAILTEPVSGWKEIDCHRASTPARQSSDSRDLLNMEKIRKIRPGYEPRISLRFLASYPNMFWLFLLTVVCWLFNLSWGMLFSITVALFSVFVVMRNIQ